MWALYSLACRLRTVYALSQGIATFLRGGWMALTPTQLVTLGFALCVALRVLIPSPPSGYGKRRCLVDSVVSIVSAASAVALTMISIADSCTFSAKAVLHMLFYG